ncbi:MAG: endonuclease [Variovorax sp.]|nr:endonuclease [Variovorax sp.]
MNARFNTWALQWEELQYQIAPCFGRIELRRRARAYLEGLLAPLERKNGWHLAEAPPATHRQTVCRTSWRVRAGMPMRCATCCSAT